MSHKANIQKNIINLSLAGLTANNAMLNNIVIVAVSLQTSILSKFLGKVLTIWSIW